MRKTFGITILGIASALAVVGPGIASAQEWNDGYRGGYYDSPRARHERKEWLKEQRRERRWREHEWHEWREHREREQFRYGAPYYANPPAYGNGYYNSPAVGGYYDQYGNWRSR